MRAPIHSVKHYVQVSLATVLAGANNAIVIATAVPIQDVNSANEVTEGSLIKAVFVEMWVRAGDTAGGSSLLTLVKVPDAQALTFADVIALNDYRNKKNILYHTQGITNDQDADAIPFIRQWFKIPKSKQRFGLGDQLVLSVAAQALDNIICGFMTYKEYT